MTSISLIRRPWKDRLVSNCDKIDHELLIRFQRERSKSAATNPEEFLAWIGLKETPTALLRVRQAAAKSQRKSQEN